MKYALLFILAAVITSCTVNVTEGGDVDEYCWADYYCSYYDYDGHLRSGYFCYEEIEPNMTCK